MTQQPGEDHSETVELSQRLLHTLDKLFQLIRYRPPDKNVKELTLKQFHAMRLLYETPGIAQKDLAERLEITPAAISTAVRHMEQLGLVERRPDPDDARQVQLFLSQYAQDSIEEVHAMRRAAMTDVLRQLSPEEQRMIVSSLERALAGRLAAIQKENQGEDPY